jgi:hypothetical protein
VSAYLKSGADEVPAMTYFSPFTNRTSRTI